MLLLVTKKENKTETKQTNKQTKKTLAARVKEKMKKQTDHFRVSPSLCFEEFDKISKMFLFVIVLSILIDFALDNLWISLGEKKKRGTQSFQFTI